MFKKKIKWLGAECLDVQIYQTLVTIIMLLTILRHIQNPGILDALRIKFQNHVKYLRWWAYWEPWHSQNSIFSRIFKDIQEYWCKFSYFDRRATWPRGWEVSPSYIWKTKRFRDSGKKFWLCPSLGLIFRSNCSFKSI